MLLGGFTLLLAACSRAAGGPATTPATGDPAASAARAVPGGATALPVPARSPLDGPYPRYRDAESGLLTVLGTPDLGPGRQRVSFVLSDAEALVRLPALQFEVVPFPSGANGVAGEPVSRGVARFHPFPADSRGLYVTSVDFPEAGTWGLRLFVPRPDGTVASTLFAFEVAESPRAPAVGQPAPPSESRTLRDAPPAELSTGSSPDPALYEQSIASALESGLPLVVVFASPGFCTNALCGPQVEQLSELRGDYAGRANFVHVDIYENPSTIRARGLEAGVRSPLLREWGLETDEWTFVVDAQGRGAARFEGFAPREEVEEALIRVLEESG